MCFSKDQKQAVASVQTSPSLASSTLNFPLPEQAQEVRGHIQHHAEEGSE